MDMEAKPPPWAAIADVETAHQSLRRRKAELRMAKLNARDTALEAELQDCLNRLSDVDGTLKAILIRPRGTP